MFAIFQPYGATIDDLGGVYYITSITNGILSVFLERKIPEEAKPKSIAITYNK